MLRGLTKKCMTTRCCFKFKGFLVAVTVFIQFSGFKYIYPGLCACCCSSPSLPPACRATGAQKGWARVVSSALAEAAAWAEKRFCPRGSHWTTVGGGRPNQSGGAGDDPPTGGLGCRRAAGVGPEVYGWAG